MGVELITRTAVSAKVTGNIAVCRRAEQYQLVLVGKRKRTLVTLGESTVAVSHGPQNICLKVNFPSDHLNLGFWEVGVFRLAIRCVF